MEIAHRRAVVLAVLGMITAAVACSDLGGLSGGEPAPAVDAAPANAPAPDADDGCPEGFQDCDGDRTNGCETRITESPSHCGFCGNVCPPAANGFPVCVDAACRVACNAGFDNCDGDDKNGCEKDVSTEPDNCGACGRSCGGPCSNGLCTPIDLMQDLDLPRALVVGRATNPTGVPQQVYFVGRSALFRGNSDGVGGAVEIVGTSPITIPRVFLDGDRVVVHAGGDLTWCVEPCTTSPPRPVYRRALPQVPMDFVVRDPTTAFALAWDPFTGITVWSFDRAVGETDAAVPVAAVLTAPGMAGAIANDDASIYVGYAESPAGLYRASRQQGTSQQLALLADASVSPHGLAVGGDRVFFVTKEKQLLGCLAASCSTTLKTYGRAEDASGLVSDGTFVYWVEPGTAAQAFQDGRLLRCPQAGCVGSPTVFAIAQHRPSAVAIFGDEIFWSIQGDSTPTAGKIRKLKK